MPGFPSIFLTSSSSIHSIEIADVIRNLLMPHANVHCWYDNERFTNGEATIADLIRIISTSHLGICIFNKDDSLKINGIDVFSTRDNVILEYGLMASRLGPNRTFIILPRGITDFHRDTVYRDFVLEDSLRHGYRFGMTLSQWNKHLAGLAKADIASELGQEYAYDVPGFDRDAYSAFFPVSKDSSIQRSREGFTVSGIFARPGSRGDTDEVFRVGGRVVDEPVLIGILMDCKIPGYRINEGIQTMVDKDELRLMAGGRLPATSDEPVRPEEVESPPASALSGVLANPPERHVHSGWTQTALLRGPFFYAVIDLHAECFATVSRNSRLEIVSMTNAWRDYHLREQIYSKTQSKLDITKYMTDQEKENYQNRRQTEELIKKAGQ